MIQVREIYTESLCGFFCSEMMRSKEKNVISGGRVDYLAMNSVFSIPRNVR